MDKSRDDYILLIPLADLKDKLRTYIEKKFDPMMDKDGEYYYISYEMMDNNFKWFEKNAKSIKVGLGEKVIGNKPIIIEEPSNPFTPIFDRAIRRVERDE